MKSPDQLHVQCRHVATADKRHRCMRKHFGYHRDSSHVEPQTLPSTAPSSRDLVPIPRVWARNGARRGAPHRGEPERRARFLTEIAQHLLHAGGKRYRPLLAQVAAELGPSTMAERSVEAGVSVELVHLGSLYHDDVIDEAETRRGPRIREPTTGRNTIAILAGDFPSRPCL